MLEQESASCRYHVCQFSGKTNNFKFFGLNFGEIAQLRAIFWFLRRRGCCNVMGGGEWSWVELGGGAWSWVEVGARFKNILSA